MITRTMGLALAAFLVTLACAVAAHASTLTFSPVPAENIELISEGSLTFESGAFRVVCAVTLSGSMSQTSFSMAAGTRFGSINRTRVETCTGGSLAFLRASESPYPLTYQSFLGTLPNVTGIRYKVGSVALQSTASGFTCLYTGEVEALMEFRGVDAWFVEPGSVTSGRTTLSSGVLCPESASLSGRLALQNMQAAMARVIQFTPGGHAFGNVRREEPRTVNATFENRAASMVKITSVVKRGRGCGSFEFNPGLVRVNEFINANTSEGISATFTPESPGLKICDFEVNVTLGTTPYQASFVAWGFGI